MFRCLPKGLPSLKLARGVFMRRDEIVELKIGPQNSNPAKNEVAQGDGLEFYLKEISNYKQLSAQEELELAKRIEQGDLQAKCELIKANLKLVITIAKKSIHSSGIPMVDLIQEGNLGLMIAAEKFNYKLGYRFATYAGWWIKQSMFKAISEQSHCMKIPVYIQETLSKYSKIKLQMEQMTNSKIKTEDIAKKMNMPANKIEKFLSAYTKTISIENGIERANGKELNVADILPDEKAQVSELIEFKSLKNDINNVISTLKQREQEVVRMRFGLDDNNKFTLEQIGNIYGVTKECIRQTELRALKKMKISGQTLLECYVH